MDILKISMVNLPDIHSGLLANIIRKEKLGSCKTITSTCSLDYFKGDIECTNFIVFYDKNISEEDVIELKAPNNIPVILITENSNFEMERTAKSNNIDLVINAWDSELVTLLYGFISQYQVYQSQHVLVVDDSRVDSYIMTNILTKDFLHNDNEHNPENVIDLLTNSESINILILDYEMPNKNGCQLMMEIKATFPKRDFIFIGITGSRNGAIKFLNDGADDVLIKPLDHDIFSLKLRKLIFNFQKTQQEQKSLEDYKNIISSTVKDISDPLYVLSTVNDVLLEKSVKTEESLLSKLQCQAAKDKLTTTFTNVQNYLELSTNLHDSSLKMGSLHSMISGQLLTEVNKAKTNNIIIKESLNPSIKNLHVPKQLEQVITYLTQNAINNSAGGSEVYIRLYLDDFNIVFEVENSNVSNTALWSSFPKKTHKEQTSINYVLCQKVIDTLGGSLGKKPGGNGDISYFKLPSYSLTSRELH